MTDWNFVSLFAYQNFRTVKLVLFNCRIFLVKLNGEHNLERIVCKSKNFVRASDIFPDIIMGARRDDSNISEITNFLVFYCKRLPRVFKAMHLSQKIDAKSRFVTENCLLLVKHGFSLPIFCNSEYWYTWVLKCEWVSSVHKMYHGHSFSSCVRNCRLKVCHVS